MAIVADTGGTSYDVSVVRRGRIPWTRETWLGRPHFGHMTGLPSVDVRSVGAGGGSIAHVDAGGLLHVGPESAGADPGPVCYGAGGTRADDDRRVPRARLRRPRLLPRRPRRSSTSTRRATRSRRRSPSRSASTSSTTRRPPIVRRGDRAHGQRDRGDHDPPGHRPARRGARRRRRRGRASTRSRSRAPLGCPEVIIPPIGPALSAAGALISDLVTSFEITFRTHRSATSTSTGVNAVLAQLEAHGARVHRRARARARSRAASSFASRPATRTRSGSSSRRCARARHRRRAELARAVRGLPCRPPRRLLDRRRALGDRVRELARPRHLPAARAGAPAGRGRAREAAPPRRLPARPRTDPVPVWRLAAIPVEEAIRPGPRSSRPRRRPSSSTPARRSAGARPARCTSCPGQPASEGGEAWTASAWPS